MGMKMEQDEGKTWEFFTSHALILSWLDQHLESTAIEIARAVGVTERTALKIIGELNRGGYLIRQRKGRHNKYHIIGETPMHHMPTFSDVPVGDLLRVMSVKKKQLAPEA